MDNIATQRFFDFANKMINLPAESQNNFFKRLKGSVSDEELKALQIGVAYFDILKNKDKHNAIMTAIAKQLYEEFNRGA